MPGYVGALLDIHDQDRFREYLKGVGPTLAKHGGRIVLRGPIAGVKLREEPVASTTAFFLDGVNLQSLAER
jgi:uncharacterized protein (DUF1330 family)